MPYCYTPNLPFLPILYKHWYLGKIPTQTSWEKLQGEVGDMQVEGVGDCDVWVKAEQKKAVEITVRQGSEVTLSWCYLCLSNWHCRISGKFLTGHWIAKYNSPAVVIGKVLKIWKLSGTFDTLKVDYILGQYSIVSIKEWFNLCFNAKWWRDV